MTTEPTFVEVAYRDLVPYKHAIWSSIGKGEPFANTVMDVQYLRDGRISVGLDSHNWMSGATDEIAPCVIDRSDRLTPFQQERVAAWKGPRRADAGPFDDLPPANSQQMFTPAARRRGYKGIMQTLLQGLRAAAPFAAGDWLITFAAVFVVCRVADTVGVL